MSERVVWKPYLDFEKEERWLNEMAAEGLEMTRYTWCRYVFEEGLPGRYTYRIQLLPKGTGARESREYLDFVESVGGEVVDTYMRWVYLRKLDDGTPFEIFTDRDSRIQHHRQVVTLFSSLAASQLPLLALGLTRLADPATRSLFTWLPQVLFTVAFIALTGGIASRQTRIVQRLTAEGALHE